MGVNLHLSNKFGRQSEIAPISKMSLPVTILGAGSLGSATAIALGKMGVPKGITIIDFDTFEEHNVPNQFCNEKTDVGKLKVDGLSDLMVSLGHEFPVVKLPKVLKGDKLIDPESGEESPVAPYLKGIVIATPDCMDARKDLWDQCKYNPSVKCFIDARMAGSFIEIHTVKPLVGDTEAYEETLYSNSEGTNLPCGQKAVIYSVMTVGSEISKMVKRVQMGQTIPENLKYDTENYIFEVTFGGKTVSNGIEVATAIANHQMGV